MNNQKDPPEIKLSETTRLEAFSDGVFAIAITLLVLELIESINPKNGENSLRSFISHWEPFIAFLIGFFTILICWINHHHVFSYINKTDTKLPWVNGFVLLMITLTPLPTAILAKYLKSEGNFALAIFGFNYFMIAIASYWLCAYSYKNDLVQNSHRAVFRYITQTYGYSIVYTLIAFLVCFISIPVAIGFYLVLFYVFAFPKEMAIKLFKRKSGKVKRSH